MAGIEEVQTISSEIPRIILASENFSKELTTCIMWLNDSWLRNEGLDIKCIRLQPHRNGDQVLIETNVVVPLPEASEYQTQLAQKERESRVQNTGLVQGRGKSQQFEGADEFHKSIARAPEKFQSGLYRLYYAAVAMEKEKLVELHTYMNSSATDVKMHLFLPGTRRYPVTFGNLLHHKGTGEINFWPDWHGFSPDSKTRIDQLIGEAKSKDGVRHRRLSTAATLNNLDEIMAAITQAYREANGLLTEDPASDE